MQDQRLSHRVDLVVHHDLAALKPLWRNLQAHPLASPHQTYEWCSAWLETMKRQPVIIEGYLDGQVAFLLPLEIIRGRLFRSLRFIGSEHSNINTGLFSDAFQRSATPGLMQDVVARLKAMRLPADLICLTGVPERWRGAIPPLALLEGAENPNHTFQLDMRENFECTMAQINGRRRRKNFRQSERRMDAWGGYDYITAETPGEKAFILDAFFRLKASRFAETGIPDCFAPACIRSFFHNVANQQDETRPDDFPLRMHAIKARDASDFAAIASITRKGDHIICQFTTIGSGPERAVSPGEMLFFKMVEDYNAQGATLFDFGMGDSRLKSSWTTTETIQRDITIPLNNIGRLAALKEEATLKAKSIVKQSPVLYAFIQRVRARAIAEEVQDDCD